MITNFCHIIITKQMQSIFNHPIVNSLSPYLALLLDYCEVISNYTYFKQISVSTLLIVSFLLGRLAHEKKLSTLLAMVNDADLTRTYLTMKLTQIESSLKYITGKKKLFIAFTVFLVLLNVLMIYFTIFTTFIVELLFVSSSIIIVMWAAYSVRSRYLKWSKKRVEVQLKTISMTASNEIKEIVDLLGQSLTRKIKCVFQQQIQAEWTKEANDDCKLNMCRVQIKGYKQLFHLYEQIINQIKQISLCDLCLHQENISIQKLGVKEFEKCVNVFKDAIGMKINLSKRKVLVNEMLKEFDKVRNKMDYICRRGCCIRQRTLIENIMSKYSVKLKRVKESLKRTT